MSDTTVVSVAGTELVLDGAVPRAEALAQVRAHAAAEVARWQRVLDADERELGVVWRRGHRTRPEPAAPRFQIRCRVREPISFGCGTARHNAQIRFHECTLALDHDGDHHDLTTGHTWRRDTPARESLRTAMAS